MDSYLTTDRPPAYCPGCTHESITQAVDRALVQLQLPAARVVIVSDIGCSGLFDTFFNTHAVHTIHGRALTHAAGLKLADPGLTVLVTMGDGGLGIGGAHLLAACRRNLDLTLLVLNNFNFGMTGGQYSLTTPTDAQAGSGFLNRAEIPVDVCAVAESGGATFVARQSGLDPALPGTIAAAIRHPGFALVETLGICTGRYTKANKLSPKLLDLMIDGLPRKNGPVERNLRPEYGEQYRSLATMAPKPAPPARVTNELKLPHYLRQEVIILGSAGMRIVTAGELLCHAGLAAGLNVSVKNDYNITVLRGQSVSEVILSPEAIGYTGISAPTIILALSQEGVDRRRQLFLEASPATLVIKAASVTIPESVAELVELDFAALKIQNQDRALAALTFLALREKALNHRMLECALLSRFTDRTYDSAMNIVTTIRRYYAHS